MKAWRKLKNRFRERLDPETGSGLRTVGVASTWVTLDTEWGLLRPETERIGRTSRPASIGGSIEFRNNTECSKTRTTERLNFIYARYD